MIEATGTLKTSHHWAWVACESDVARYYQWLLWRLGVKLQYSVWKAHITAIRETDDIVVPESLQGLEIAYTYDPEDIYTNGNHWWIEVQSPQLEEIRESLGLPPQPFFSFHLTLGNEVERRFGCRFGEQFLR